MPQELKRSRPDAVIALARHADASEENKSTVDVCMRCGLVKPVARSIPVEMIGEKREEYATFCVPCARRVKR